MISQGMRIDIETGNAAFDGTEREEIVRILREAAMRIEAGEDFPTILDTNGNRVGIVSRFGNVASV